ncbi:uncharacterized protein LOC116415762 isoform X2 [Nasonia vitripennis]|uniref:Uncharacterized protein n=1 Tax=Nasonia vitripennis TaxID=7425 RepID=A0A7M7QW12_NASVI|nr:uncharacterized protein LOC116415762 isoform X2 [Nasonia vitripennis]
MRLWPRRERELYKSFIDDLIVIPGESNLETGRVDVTTDDHSLNLDQNSKWQTFFKDNKLGCEYPCKAIMHSNGQKRLHQRVHHTVLKSASVEEGSVSYQDRCFRKKGCRGLHTTGGWQGPLGSIRKNGRFCFTNLMAEIRDFFIKCLDKAKFGINAMISKLDTQVEIPSSKVLECHGHYYAKF